MKNTNKPRRQRALEIVHDHFPGVKKIEDATEDLHFEVNASDIAKGKAGVHTECPGAQALNRETRRSLAAAEAKQSVKAAPVAAKQASAKALTKGCETNVGTIMSKRTCYIIKGETAYRYRVPEAITREEVAVDRGGTFQPGNYTLKAPKKGEMLTDMHTGATHNKSDRSRPKFSRANHVTEAMRTSLGGRTHIS